MKEITYNKDNSGLYVVDQGEYKGMRYFFLGGGEYPFAYVLCEETFLLKHKTDWGGLDCVEVHGGVTWTDDVSLLKVKPEGWTGIAFGWDYGHHGDWTGYHTEEENRMFGCRKYTSEDIFKDCRSAIDQYVDALTKDREEMAQDDHYLTKEILKDLGFESTLKGFTNDNELALHRMGITEGKKWNIYVDLQSPGLTYARNEKTHRKYEGSILTLEELKKVVDLLHLPIEV